MKENKNINKYMYVACELKNLWNMKVTMILNVIRELGESGDQRKIQVYLDDSNVKVNL